MHQPSASPANAEQTLQRWRARESDLAARAAPVGLARPDQIAGKTGLQIFEAMLAGALPRAPISTTLKFWLVEASLGHAEFQGAPAFEHYNPLGGVHGGWMATLLDSCVHIVWGELKHRGRLVKDYGDVPPLHGNESRLAQVFLNLIVNAVQALPSQAREDSKVRISTRHEDGLVMVSIHDTGIGIPEQHLCRLFEPFFTTKPVGEGMGLGLSVSFAIVRDHGGKIEVESEPGRGSTFRVRLPTRAVSRQRSAVSQDSGTGSG